MECPGYASCWPGRTNTHSRILKKMILEAVDKFCRGAAQQDDITVLLARYRTPADASPPGAIGPSQTQDQIGDTKLIPAIHKYSPFIRLYWFPWPSDSPSSSKSSLLWCASAAAAMCHRVSGSSRFSPSSSRARSAAKYAATCPRRSSWASRIPWRKAGSPCAALRKPRILYARRCHCEIPFVWVDEKEVEGFPL